jgi:hypothetical protein
MNESVAEALILAINALGAGILLFIAGVIQPIMNGMAEPDFKRFLNALDRTAMTNHFAVTIATLPIIAAVVYFISFGPFHWWFTAGLVLWLIGSSITKIMNMPVYKWVGDPNNNDFAELRKGRRKLHIGNNLRAWLTLASVVLMACQFGVREVASVLAFSAFASIPLVWWARKYIPN